MHAPLEEQEDTEAVVATKLTFPTQITQDPPSLLLSNALSQSKYYQNNLSHAIQPTQLSKLSQSQLQVAQFLDGRSGCSSNMVLHDHDFPNFSMSWIINSPCRGSVSLAWILLVSLPAPVAKDIDGFSSEIQAVEDFNISPYSWSC